MCWSNPARAPRPLLRVPPSPIRAPESPPAAASEAARCPAAHVPPAHLHDDPFITAAKILARRDRGIRTGKDDAEDLAWLHADPRHAAALSRLEALWARLDVLQVWCPFAADAPDPDLLASPRGRRAGQPLTAPPPDDAARALRRDSRPRTRSVKPSPTLSRPRKPDGS